MANVLTGTVWLVDTAASTLTAGRCMVRGVRWVGATTNAHTAVITDTAGKVLWASQAATATLGTPEESRIEFSANGLKVPTLGSGILYLYL